ncbi:MAG: aminotransferase class V-fold PLP-dependent enzyme [Lachnospiraceae bacterium]
MKEIYFDNSSTSFPKAEGVGAAMSDFISGGAFNVNRGNYEGAYQVADTILAARERLAVLFHAPNSRQVIFTPSVTYSLNYLIKGLLRAGDHVVVTGMEHNAVMRPLNQLMEQGVITYDVVAGNQEGEVCAADFSKKIHENTRLVIALHASNVSGTIIPIEEIGKICREAGIYFGVDTAQTAGTLDIDMEKCQIDFLAFTGHKGLLGPQGIGGFIISERLNRELDPLIAGGTGSQSDSFAMPGTLPDKYESGTLNLPGIIGLNAALIYLEKIGRQNLHNKKMELTAYFLKGLKGVPGVRVIGKQGIAGRTAVVSVDFVNQDNAVMAFELEHHYGIMTRVGLHCAPIAHRTLNTYPEGTVRFSFSAANTREEIDLCIVGLKTLTDS